MWMCEHSASIRSLLSPRMRPCTCARTHSTHYTANLHTIHCQTVSYPARCNHATVKESHVTTSHACNGGLCCASQEHRVYLIPLSAQGLGLREPGDPGLHVPLLVSPAHLHQRQESRHLSPSGYPPTPHRRHRQQPQHYARDTSPSSKLRRELLSNTPRLQISTFTGDTHFAANWDNFPDVNPNIRHLVPFRFTQSRPR